MERLDQVVARVLAGLRVVTEEEAGGAAVAAAPPLARGPGGESPDARKDAGGHERASQSGRGVTGRPVGPQTNHA